MDGIKSTQERTGQTIATIRPRVRERRPRQDTGKSLLAESCQADTGLPAAAWENSLPAAPSIFLDFRRDFHPWQPTSRDPEPARAFYPGPELSRLTAAPSGSEPAPGYIHPSLTAPCYVRPSIITSTFSSARLYSLQGTARPFKPRGRAELVVG